MEPEGEKANVKCEKGEECPCVCRFTFPFSHRHLLVTIVCGLLAYSGCEQSFHPLKENNQYAFSIYGYLDATADTQWVRVTPARQQLSTDTIPEMTVTLEELETGNSAVMNDSLFTLANGIRFVNVWTTMDIKPEHTYRLQARRPDGGTSNVTVSTPADFPTPTLEFPFPGNICSGRLTIKGVKRLVDVQSVWRLRLNSSGYIRNIVRRFAYRGGSRVIGQNTYRIFIPFFDALILPAGVIEKNKRELFVASAGPEWNSNITSINNLEYALPDRVSNVKNGVGYMIGIVGKTIPYDRHYIFDDQHQFIECTDKKPDNNGTAGA